MIDVSLRVAPGEAGTLFFPFPMLQPPDFYADRECTALSGSGSVLAHIKLVVSAN